MNLFAPISSWWRALARRSQTDSDVEDELQFHIDAHANHLIDSGIAPAEAMRQAKVEFGRVDVQKEKYGAAIGLRPLYEIGGDIRYGIRSLYRHPWISVAAVISLALGIGATTAMFNVIYSALLHPFPYADVDRIVNPALTNDKHPDLPTWFALTPPQYASFVQAKSIDSVLGFMLAGMQETGGQLPEDVSVAFVTSNIDSFLKALPFIGRGIQPADASQNVSPYSVTSTGTSVSAVIRRFLVTLLTSTTRATPSPESCHRASLLPRPWEMPMSTSRGIPREAPGFSPGSNSSRVLHRRARTQSSSPSSTSSSKKRHNTFQIHSMSMFSRSLRPTSIASAKLSRYSSSPSSFFSSLVVPTALFFCWLAEKHVSMSSPFAQPSEQVAFVSSASF
jgi:hypothetical protein